MDISQQKWNNKKITVPTVIQMEVTECGAASLGMILAYFGKYVSLEELREECAVSRNGSNAVNIAKAARNYGLEANGFKATTAESLKKLPLPIIIFWNFNHFVVLTGIKKNKVYINDPAIGPRKIDMEEFNTSFTGFALFFDKTPAFKTGGKKPTVITPLIKRLKGSFSSVSFLFITGLLLTILGLINPVFQRVFIDNILVGHDFGWINSLLKMMGFIGLISGIILWLQSNQMLLFQTKIGVNNSAEFFLHLLKLPVSFFFHRHNGTIVNRIDINKQVASLLSGKIASNLLNIMLVFLYVVLMVQYDLLLTLIGILMAVLSLLYFKFSSINRVNISQRFFQENAKLFGTVTSGMQVIETIKSNGAESDLFSQVSSYNSSVINTKQEAEKASILLLAVPILLSSLNTGIILIFGAMRVLDGTLTMGMLVAFQALMASFFLPINNLLELGSEIQDLSVKFGQLDDILLHKKENIYKDSCEGNERGFKLKGKIEFQNITFGYSKLETPLLKDLSFTINPGDRVAFVGASGVGKSTIAKLVSGLYQPWSGNVLFDDKPRSDYTKAFFMDSVSCVDQDIVMFNATIKENITLWDETIPAAHIHQAAVDASIHNEISFRLAGYDSTMTEGGTNYSGGERQRLEIARSLVNNPSILILDEATSALDPTTEKKVHDSIIKRGCTCLIIAHRLSTIRDCSRIIVIDNGEIVQNGTHEELIAIDGKYKEFVEYTLTS